MLTSYKIYLAREHILRLVFARTVIVLALFARTVIVLALFARTVIVLAFFARILVVLTCRKSYVFNRKNQGADKTFDSYLSELRKLAKSYNFCDRLRDLLMRDRIVMGIRDA